MAQSDRQGAAQWRMARKLSPAAPRERSAAHAEVVASAHRSSVQVLAEGAEQIRCRVLALTRKGLATVGSSIEVNSASLIGGVIGLDATDAKGCAGLFSCSDGKDVGVA